MISDFSMKGRKKISYLFELIKYNRNFHKNNPTYFYPDGLLVFCGGQGTGKTLSAVNYSYCLFQIYPRCKIVTNIDLRDYPVVELEGFISKYLLFNELANYDSNLIESALYDDYLEYNRVFRFNDATDLKRYKNGKEGVIFLIDEIHLYFNSLQSKNINMDVMTQIAQQRKQRIHIVATTQVFGRMAKPLREQFSNVVLCKSYLNFIQKNSLIDRDSIDGEESTGTNLSGTVVKNYFWFRSPKMFERYDTYAVINNKNLSAGLDVPQNIYGGTQNGY